MENYPKTEPALTNIAELFKKPEYSEKLESMKDLIKVKDLLDRPLIITGYKEDKMPDIRKPNTEKDCFRMDFRFADDPTETPHFIRTEARYLWDYLKAVNEVNPELLSSGTIVALICKGEKKSGAMNNTFYYFAGTMDV